jgi:hypothetical protein
MGMIGLPFQNPASPDLNLDGWEVVSSSRVREIHRIGGELDGELAPVDAVDGLKVNLGGDNDVIVSDIQDGAGDSIMDVLNDAVRVNVVAGAAAGVSHVDDAAFTVAVDEMVPAGALYQVTPDLVDDGDAGLLRMTQRRALLVSHETPGGNSMVDEGANALQVSLVSNSGGARLETEDGSIEEDQTLVLMAASLPYSHDGAAWTRAGATPQRFLDVDETEDEVKATAAVLYGYAYANLHATVVHYLKFYDGPASTVVVGTDVPKIVMPIQPKTAGHIHLGEKGVDFPNGICIAALTGLADGDTTGAGTNEVVVSTFTK